MSKIQKALQRVRSSDYSISRGKNTGTGDDSNRSENVQGRAASEDSAAAGNSNLPAKFADEHVPDYKVFVAEQSLQEQGLQPAHLDMDLIAQQFRRIKRPVLSIAFGESLPEAENSNVIMVASALPKSGKSFCSFNLATSIARERDVGAIMVDADVLKPNISRAFGLEDRLGLIDYLLDSSVTVDDILVNTNVFGIMVVPAGRQHEDATELLASRRMKQFVESMAERYSSRAIIVDTPPLLLTNEAHVLAEHMGQIVLVIEAGHSTHESVTQALESLNRTKPINAILNKARGTSFGEYGGHSYGYYSPSGYRHGND